MDSLVLFIIYHTYFSFPHLLPHTPSPQDGDIATRLFTFGNASTSSPTVNTSPGHADVGFCFWEMFSSLSVGMDGDFRAGFRMSTLIAVLHSCALPVPDELVMYLQLMLLTQLHHFREHSQQIFVALIDIW